MEVKQTMTSQDSEKNRPPKTDHYKWFSYSGLLIGLESEITGSLDVYSIDRVFFSLNLFLLHRL